MSPSRKAAFPTAAHVKQAIASPAERPASGRSGHITPDSATDPPPRPRRSSVFRKDEDPSNRNPIISKTPQAQRAAAAVPSPGAPRRRPRRPTSCRSKNSDSAMLPTDLSPTSDPSTTSGSDKPEHAAFEAPLPVGRHSTRTSASTATQLQAARPAAVRCVRRAGAGNARRGPTFKHPALSHGIP